MAEKMITMFFLCIAAIPMLILGAVQYRSVDPVGFWSGKEPPKPWQITDVKNYNHKHGAMWMLYGAGMIFCALFGVLFDEAEIATIGILVEVIGGLFVMIWYHHYLDSKYYRP